MRFWGALGGGFGGVAGGVAGGEELFDENRHRLNDFDGHRNLDVGNLENKIHKLN